MDKDYKNYMEKVTKITNSINAKILEESNNYDKWYEDVMPKMDFILQCQEEIETKICRAQTSIDKMKTMKEELEKVLDEKRQQVAEIKDNYKDKVDECKAFTKEYENLERMCKETREQTKLSQKDEEVLSLARKKYEIYKEITNIIWDYSVPHTVMASGYVRNKSNGYVHPFEFKKNAMTHSELVENLWKEIEMGAQDDWSDIVEMTNKPAPTVNKDDEENITQNN